MCSAVRTCRFGCRYWQGCRIWRVRGGRDVGSDWGLVVLGGFVCQDEDSGVAAYAGLNLRFINSRQMQMFDYDPGSTRSGSSSSG